MNSPLMPVVLLVHGWNVTHPEQGVYKFRKHVEHLGGLVEYFSYGYVPHTWQLIKRNPGIAKHLAERVYHWHDRGRQVYVICHSNGAAVTRMARQLYQAPIARVLAMHPALSVDLNVCWDADKVIVVHNQGDRAVVAGSALSWIWRKIMPSKYQARPWGQQGQDGYTGRHRNVENIDSAGEVITQNTNANPLPVPRQYRAWGHSQEFKEPHDKFWLPYLAARLMV